MTPELLMQMLKALKRARPMIGAACADPTLTHDRRVLREKIYKEITAAIDAAEKAK